MNSTLYPPPVGEPQAHALPPTPSTQAAPHLCRLSSNGPITQLNPGRAQHELGGPAPDSKPPFGGATGETTNNRTAEEGTWGFGSPIRVSASSVPDDGLDDRVGMGRPEQSGNNRHSRGNYPFPSIQSLPLLLTSCPPLPAFYHTRVELTSCDTSSSGQSVSHIPKSKTWSITSTIQRVSTDNNGFPTESCPARVSSVVQSTPFSVPPGSPRTTTGRTSVTRLRKSFDLGIHQNDGNTSPTGKSTLLLPVDEHPAEDSLPRRRLQPNALGSPNRDRAAELSRYDGRIPTLLPHHLDGTPNPPTPPDEPVEPKPQRKGKVTELKKAFERGFSGFVRKRQTTESREEGADREAVAKHPRRPRHSVTAIPVDTSSPEDTLSKGSLFCSPLPKKFRREPNVPSSPLKDRISIFEGLVKPSSSSSLTTGCHQGNSDTASFLSGDKILDDVHNEPTSPQPSKFPGAPAVGEGSTKQLRTGRREPGDGSNQVTGKADPPSFLRRLSSTFNHKRKPSRQRLTVARSSGADCGAEETTQHPSRVSQSTTTNQKHAQSEKRRISAADSLRKRLESELRPGASTNGPREIQADELAGSKQQHDSLTGPSGHRKTEKPSIEGTRRKTTLWDIENPFDVPKAKERSKSEATGGRLKINGGHTESNNLSKVALARNSSIRDVPQQKSSASWYPEITEMPEPQETQSGNRTNSISAQVEDGSDRSGSRSFVVVANAECEMTHPRPSRSSDKKMIKVLCKCGRETGEEQHGGGRDSFVSVSDGSSASFHTAPISTSAF